MLMVLTPGPVGLNLCEALSFRILLTMGRDRSKSDLGAMEAELGSSLFILASLSARGWDPAEDKDPGFMGESK